jgi:hypothetical protein
VRAYYLRRNEDLSGMSGTGRVAEVAVFDDGTAVIRWIDRMNSTRVSSTAIFDSVDDLLKIHGHGGRTVLEPIVTNDHTHSASVQGSSLK